MKMNPPFTVEEFLAVFSAYNAAIWPLQIIAYAAGLLAVATLWHERLHANVIIPVVLALLWACNGIGYHFIYFSTINPLAKGFAVFFVAQAILFVVAAMSAKKLEFVVEPNLRSTAGIAIIVFALLIYPILGIIAGHGFMAGPMFGVAPCPTTIFTIGILFLACGKWVLWLSIIPILWCLVGLAAALQLGIPEDFGLPVAGFLLVIALAFDAMHGRKIQTSTTERPGSAGR
jgi:Family of unknown function (DUF6064)